MTPSSLRFSRIRIRRMPGFDHGGFEVQDLCAGINIVCGPNESGKTTLGRAIRKLLWTRSEPAGNVSLWANVEVGDSRGTMDYDGGRLRYQEGGLEADRPPLPPAECADRYTLALNRLLQHDDEDLARTIVNESAGGYDLAEVRDALGLRESPPRATKEARAWRDANEKVSEVRRGQASLIDEESKLAELLDENQVCNLAATRVALLQRALEYHRRREDRDAAKARVDSFPTGMDRIAGNEIERLERFRADLATADEQLRAAQSDLEQTHRKREICNLPAGGLDERVLIALRQYCEKLRGLEGGADTTQQAFCRAEAERKNAQGRLGDGVNVEQLTALDASKTAKLFDFARRAEAHRIQWQLLSGEKALLEGDSPTGNPDELREGMTCLLSWLAVAERSGHASSIERGLVTVGGALIAVLTGVLAWFVHAAWLVLLPAGLALIAWIWWPRHAADRRGQLQAEFESLSLGTPDRWSADGVRQFARRVQDEFGEALVRARHTARRQDLTRKIAQAAEAGRKFQEEHKTWLERFGLGPGFGNESLVVLAENMSRLHDADARMKGTQAEFSQIASDRRRVLETINATLGQYGRSTVEDYARAVAEAEGLDSRARRWSEANTAIQALACESEQLSRTIDAHKASIADLYNQAAVDEGDEANLRELVRLHAEYLEAADKLRSSQNALTTAGEAISEHADLLEARTEDLEQELRGCEEKARRLEALNQEIGRIQEKLTIGKHATALEQALAVKDNCEYALRESRTGDQASAVGSRLVEFVAKEQHDRQRPDVFRRAEELFARVTHGRRRLLVSDGPAPTFRALDTALDVGQPLEELSSGTRVQLLLAVRLAFVEQQETGLKLPLVLDETLGNSDEARARQIIEAAIEICREGRQVFYFTAQQDEVGKWRRMLEDAGDVPYRVVDMAEIRGFSEQERMPLVPLTLPSQAQVPAPGDDDYLHYGRRLGIEPFDIFAPLGQVHLWYLIDDVPQLFGLLQQGINRWGQFKTIVEYDQGRRYPADGPLLKSTAACARVLEAITDCCGIGHGRPVDRAVLVASGAITETFLDRVAALGDEHNGDAREIIRALERREVSRFRDDALEILRNYLADKGYLDDREPLPPEAIRDRVLARSLPDVDASHITAERVNQLLEIVRFQREGNGRG